MSVASPPCPAKGVPDQPSLPPGKWPAQGEWTYEDYLRLPDVPGWRYEILFGVLYMANTPETVHQVVVTELAISVGAFVKAQSLGRFLVAPVEVRLPGFADPVQPDALVVLAERRSIIQRQFVDGPPGPGGRGALPQHHARRPGDQVRRL